MKKKFCGIRHTPQSSTCCFHGPVDMSHRESHFQQPTGDKHLCPFWWLRRKRKVHKKQETNTSLQLDFEIFICVDRCGMQQINKISSHFVLFLFLILCCFISLQTKKSLSSQGTVLLFNLVFISSMNDYTYLSTG